MANEKRLIDANVLIEDLEAAEANAGMGAVVARTLIRYVKRCATVDAVEVVHGRCEYCKDGKSFIGARMLLGNDGKWHDINNCPNCGAKMDGGVNSD